MAGVQILTKETLSEKKYPLKYVTFQKPDREGKMQLEEKEVYFRPDAVAVLLADKNQKKFLLTKQFRLPAYLNGNETGFLIEACAGLIDKDETPEQTARREVKEETGYEVGDLKKIAGAYTSAGGITEFLHLFIASYNSEKNHKSVGGLEEEGEHIELVELGFDEAREKLRRGEFRDVKIILLLQYYFLEEQKTV